MATEKSEYDNARASAVSHYEWIAKTITACEAASEEENHEKADELRDEILMCPLSVQVRSGWCTPQQLHNGCAEEYEILLSTGGPACRIVGNLDDNGTPETARLEYQDWFLPWQAWDGAELEKCDFEMMPLAFAQQFYYGEE